MAAIISMTLRSITLGLWLIFSLVAHSQQSQIQPVPTNNLRPHLNEVTQFSRYTADNETLGPPAAGVQRVVFFGDSITDNWGRKAGTFFTGKPYVNRGISGQKI